MPTDKKRTGTLTTNTEKDMTSKTSGSAKKKKSLIFNKGTLCVAFAVAAAVPAVWEAKYSTLTEHVATRLAHGQSGFGYSAKTVTTTPEANSPFDKTRGYADILKDDEILRKQNYSVSDQVPHVERKLLGVELYSIADPKLQAGMAILDDTGKKIYDANYPRQVFKDFNDIPLLWVKSLLHVENRELLDHQHDSKNVTLEVDRLGLAVIKQIQKKLGMHVDAPGGSGLGVQVQKQLHSPEARTGNAMEKVRQLLTATTKYYNDHDAQKIVLEYVTFAPLASTKLDGEVIGFAEGMKIWFGRDLDQVKTMLNTEDDTLDENGLKLKAQIYREALALVMAVKKPSDYFNGPLKKGAHLAKPERQALGHADLEQRVDVFLPQLIEKGIISENFAKIVKAERLQFVDQSIRQEPDSPSPYKYVNNLRIQTQQVMKKPSLYDLDRMDLTAKSTMIASLNHAAEEVLQQIKDPEFARANKLVGGPEGKFVFDERDLPYIKGAIIINERLPDGSNVSRVLTDNVKDSPMNQVSGGRQGMGSTSKFRWGLTVYELSMGELYDKYSTKTPEELKARLKEISINDNLTRWALTTLSDPKNAGITFDAFLDAALERNYSGNPGGTEVQNFDNKENSWNVSVKKNFHFSVNAAFIRIMRDNVSYVIYEKMGIDPKMFDDMSHPARDAYLEDFTKQEGAIFLYRAYREQQDLAPADVEKLLIAKTKFRSASQMAALFRYLHPNDSVEQMKSYILANAEPKEVQKLLTRSVSVKASKAKTPPADPFAALYKAYAPGAYDQPAQTRVNKKTGEVRKISAVYDLNERSYKLKVHPMALWLAKFRIDNPDAKFSDANKAAAVADAHNGKSAYRQSYDWLFKPSKFAAQKRSLISIIRHKAFNDYLGPQQKTLGYPFDKVVDSEKIVLGSNGDTPAALATLMGVVQGNGILKKTDTFSAIARGEGTEFERIATKNAEDGKIVMRPEIARSLREQLQGVVTEGTGKKLAEAFKIPAYDVAGNVIPNTYRLIPNGGKTGSDDGKLKSGGRVIDAKSRTATWTFIIGDKLSGTVFLYIDGHIPNAPAPANGQQQTAAPTASKKQQPLSKSSNPALRAHFTSSTAVITARIFFARPEVQAFIAQEFKDSTVEGETLVVDKAAVKAAAAAKAAAAPKAPANDHKPAATKPKKPAAAAPN